MNFVVRPRAALLFVIALLGGSPLPSTAQPGFLRNNLSGTYRVGSAGVERLWHEWGEGDRLVSTRYYTDDSYTRFTIERQPGDFYRGPALDEVKRLYLENKTFNETRDQRRAQ